MPARDSPPHRRRSPPPARSSSRGERGGERDRRERRDGGEERVKRERSASPRRGGGGEYSSADRERERTLDRKRYEEDAVDRPKSPPKPNFANTGLLAKEANTVKGVALKYHEPPEARKPVQNWRLYVFKGEEQVDLVHIYRQSCFLVGRDAVVADVPVQHPSCSKQHAVIQFRLIRSKNEFGEEKSVVKPFVLDLDSTNGTYVNGEEIPKTRYYELRAGDVLKFGTSQREYVLLHEDAK